MKKYVAYLRVRLAKQGRAELGLAAQRQAVQAYIGEAALVAEFLEIESGKRNERLELLTAIGYAKAMKATLLIAKFGRLSRSNGFLATLRDTGVDFMYCDMPNVTTHTVGELAVKAQHERALISTRTKEALAARKVAGAALGRPASLTNRATRTERATKQRNAVHEDNHRKAIAHILLLSEQGLTYAQIAKHLNNLSLYNSSGQGLPRGAGKTASPTGQGGADGVDPTSGRTQYVSQSNRSGVGSRYYQSLPAGNRHRGY